MTALSGTSLYKTAGHEIQKAAILRRDQRQYQAWLTTVYFVILGTLTFNLILAFANTNLFRISESYVIISEMVLLSAALVLALNRQATLFVILGLYFSYMAMVLALRPELDLKAIRDMLIPITFYFLGTQFRRLEDIDRLIWISTAIILTIGMFEFFFLENYTSIIDIFQYYVARGTLEADENFVSGSNLFVSSIRISGRNFLEFLGNIRASSVFLEPVTMGNFGAFLCMWALFRTGMKRRWLMFTAAFLVVVLADARFGMMVCLAFFPVAVTYRLFPRFFWWSVPFLFMLGLALYGGWTRQVFWSDDLFGRILHSAQIMMELTPTSVFGIEAELPFVADNGFAYTLTQIGLVGIIALWALYIFAPSENDKALQYKAMVVTFICLNMTISNSVYSIKLAALFWLAAGVADAVVPTKSDQEKKVGVRFRKHPTSLDKQKEISDPRPARKYGHTVEPRPASRNRAMRSQRLS